MYPCALRQVGQRWGLCHGHQMSTFRYSGMAVVGCNCSAVFRGERQAERAHCRPGRAVGEMEKNNSRVAWLFLSNSTLRALKFFKVFFEIVRRHCCFLQRAQLEPAAVCCLLSRKGQFLQVHPQGNVKTGSSLQTVFALGFSP